MLDQYGRNINYLRISITDRCNLKCIYCIPKSGVQLLNENDILTFDEIYKIVKISSDLGISKVRITGGEPLMRKGVHKLIYDIKALPKIEQVHLTTNGMLLEQYIDELIESGLDGINISLDTLDDKKYEQITGGGNLEKVKNGIRFAINKNKIGVKLNTVIIKGKNDDEIMDFVGLAEKFPVDIRFIELMPIGEGKSFKPFTNEDIKKVILKERQMLRIQDKVRYSGPAVYFRTTSSKGKIGFISPMSHAFCGECNRVRLTAEGFLKQCLHWKSGVDLRSIMRNDFSDEKIKKVILEAIYNKPYKHEFGEKVLNKDNRMMCQIGG